MEKQTYNCVRCTYGWKTRLYTVPKQCPRCHNYKWNMAKKQKYGSTSEYIVASAEATVGPQWLVSPEEALAQAREAVVAEQLPKPLDLVEAIALNNEIIKKSLEILSIDTAQPFTPLCYYNLIKQQEIDGVEMVEINPLDFAKVQTVCEKCLLPSAECNCIERSDLAQSPERTNEDVN